MKKLLLCLTLFAALMSIPRDVSAFGKKRSVQPDTIMDPVAAGDVTGLVEGCGAQPIVGFTWCRIQEGDAADQTISFIGPPAECSDSETSCVFIKVFDQAGQIAWGGSIPKGQTRIYVPWKTLLGAPQFQVGNRGFWSWVVEVHSVDPDDHIRISKTQGEIVLRVYKKGYVPLDRVESDPNFVWTWAENGRTYRMTQGLRAFVGAK